MSIAKKPLLLAVGLAVAATSVQAQSIQLTPVVGYRFFGSLQDWTGSKIDVADAMSWGGFVTFMPDRVTGYEFGFSRQDTDARLSVPFAGIESFDVKVDYWSLGGTRHFPRPGSSVVPFANGLLGMGRMSSSDGDDSLTKFMLGAGGGIKFLPPDAALGLRFEARGNFTFAGSGGASVGCGTGGCAFGFGGQAFFQLDLQAGIILRMGDR